MITEGKCSQSQWLVGNVLSRTSDYQGRYARAAHAVRKNDNAVPWLLWRTFSALSHLMMGFRSDLIYSCEGSHENVVRTNLLFFNFHRSGDSKRQNKKMWALHDKENKPRIQERVATRAENNYSPLSSSRKRQIQCGFETPPEEKVYASGRKGARRGPRLKG